MLTATRPQHRLTRTWSEHGEKSFALAQPETSEIIYPDSDGEPMGETGIHVQAIMYLYSALMTFFQAVADVYVATDMFLYYEEGNPKAVKAPDVMVIKGVDGTYERRSFKLWEEQRGPCVIFEVTSKSSMLEDLVNKSMLYAQLGVREYFIFDPLQEYLEPQLTGFRLEDHQYTHLDPDDQGRLFSQELGLQLVPDRNFLRLLNPKSGRLIPGHRDAADTIRQLEQQAEQEAQRAEQEARRAEQEKLRAEAAEAELTRLRALLGQNA
ncbi:hypothetical protein U27_03035 [Candidatus Vecturithrix granuli]|uniref:Putative restriction endonuclease domain-containing protein n=1 Tax=Vecturithrix granuli TaxID=1499967 RepID=A0A081BUR8_VECG1|nr:hypothetical protein U27_03035 [Candidatus Vecturithrix granuli]